MPMRLNSCMPHKDPDHSAEPTTLDRALEGACSNWAQRPALSWGHQTMTYGELGKAVTALATDYRRLGLAPGARIVCWLATRPEHLIATLAAWRIGAVHVGADVDLAPRELAWRLAHSGATALVVPADNRAGEVPQTCREAIRIGHDQCPNLQVIRAQPAFGRRTTTLSVAYGRLAGGAPEQRPSAPDPAVIIYTSGTTATPKGVVRFHGPLATSWTRSGEVLAASADDVHLIHLPLAHGFGLGMAVMGLLTGGCLVLLEHFSAESALALIGSKGVTILHGTPAHFALLTDALDPSRHDVSSLACGRAAAQPLGFRPGCWLGSSTTSTWSSCSLTAPARVWGGRPLTAAICWLGLSADPAPTSYVWSDRTGRHSPPATRERLSCGVIAPSVTGASRKWLRVAGTTRGI